MYFVSVTRLRVRSIRFLPAFLLASRGVARFIKNVDGFAVGRELLDKNLTFWTATVWLAEADMKTFRSGEPHKKAMRKLPHWCDEAAYAHWKQEENTLPDWGIVHERLLAEGRLSKVKYPSIQQGVMAYPPPQWSKTQRILAAKASG